MLGNACPLVQDSVKTLLELIGYRNCWVLGRGAFGASVRCTKRHLVQNQVAHCDTVTLSGDNHGHLCVHVCVHFATAVAVDQVATGHNRLTES